MSTNQHMKQCGAVVFSDLDGTLVDHDTYSFEAAKNCLAVLRRRGIPLILASSKTSSEIVPLRRELGFPDCPAICENGAGLIEAGADEGAGSSDYSRLRRLLDEAPPALRRQYRGFGDMSAQEVAAATGLSPFAAELAQRREFSEPGVWSGSEADREALLEVLRSRGVSATRGGRFLTLSFGATKADRMAEILARYGQPPSIALGDAPNDIDMIEAADHGVIVANPAHAPLPTLPGEANGRIIRTKKSGPEGWSEAVMRLLSDLRITG